MIGKRWMTRSGSCDQQRQQERAAHEQRGALLEDVEQRQMTAPSLKMGRYIAMTRPPTSTPRMTMISGSSSSRGRPPPRQRPPRRSRQPCWPSRRAAGFLADRDHLHDHVREQARVLHARCCAAGGNLVAASASRHPGRHVARGAGDGLHGFNQRHAGAEHGASVRAKRAMAAFLRIGDHGICSDMRR